VKFTKRSLRAASHAPLLTAILGFAAPLSAQGVEPLDLASSDAIVATRDRQVYPAGYFSRFAPSNALDMVRQIPGFTIRTGESARGLGEATDNVLVNGARLARKSEDITAPLARIQAGDVQRIEVVDGTTLGIPGLTGQVANLIVAQSDIGMSFRYEGAVFFDIAKPELWGGEVSVSGKNGKLGYTAAISNYNYRFGFEGPSLYTLPDGSLIRREDLSSDGKDDLPKLSVDLSYDFASDVAGNLNFSIADHDFSYAERGDIHIPDVAEGVRDRLRTDKGPEYELAGDLAFPLLSGRLKLIGLTRYDRNDYAETFITRFLGTIPDQGNRFTQDAVARERIARAEFAWPMWGADWQLSGEAAFNSLDSTARLFSFDDAGQFVEIPLPGGEGEVAEDRYETILSVTEGLTPTLNLQARVGAEFSKIEQTGNRENAREFRRPKGAVAFAWKPSDALDVSLGLERSVGQLDFGDFLASVNLGQGTGEAGNIDLVPEQSWDVTFEIAKRFGPWGSATARIERRWIEDYIDFIPLPDGQEGRGNITSASSTSIELAGTLQLEPIGVKGAKIDISGKLVDTNLLDPTTNRHRSFSAIEDRSLDIRFRHDLPESDWAYGAGLFSHHVEPYFRFDQIGTVYDGPSFGSFFVERKDVIGLTARVELEGLLQPKGIVWRKIYDGSRADSVIASLEERDRRISPAIRFTISGNV